MNENNLKRLKVLKEELVRPNLSEEDRRRISAEINAIMGSNDNSYSNKNVNKLEGGKKLVRKNNNIKGFVSNVSVIVFGTLFSILTAVVAAIMMIK